MDADPSITPAQRRYLAAFDRFLRARTMEERIRARSLMSQRLNSVFKDAHVELPNDTRWRDSIGWEREHNHNGRGHNPRGKQGRFGRDRIAIHDRHRPPD